MIPQKPRNASVSLLLHDIRSVHNVGSIFRTADAFGVARIYISGVTPTPKDRFGRARADLAKVALGAEQTVPHEVIEGGIDGVHDFIKKMKKSGMKIVALEQDARSVHYREVHAQNSVDQPILLIVGNEVDGVDKKTLDIVDVIAEIPMQGKKESLNVSVATGIALFGMFE
ncbi:MAG: hypothetical protein RIT04_185 [Candidatus Parcubacteria bacterium]|jgi:tRNA G18 (ribose-2'-O)-methylase SpoU